jgi:hypothetical protein
MQFSRAISSLLGPMRKTWLNLHPPHIVRPISLNRPRPSPHPLPKEDQREFEELIRKAQSAPADVDPTTDLHPDARRPVKAGFEGDINPATGEKGGPKREPVGKWSGEGDWSFNGRVSDF